MDLIIYLNNQMQLNTSVEGYIASEFAEMLNSPQITTVKIGRVVISKTAFMAIIPKEHTEGNVTLYLNSGLTFKLQVDDYNADVFATDLNNRQNEMAAIGNAILNKHSFMMVVPDELEQLETV